MQILPRLTTVKLLGAEIGAMGVRILHSRVAVPGFPSTPLRVLVPARIIERQSVGPARRAATRGPVAAIS